MSIGSIIDGEPTTLCKILALKRALIETVADAGATTIDPVSMKLLLRPVNYLRMSTHGGGVTGHKAARLQPGSSRVQNPEIAQIEEHLADIDRQLVALGGS